jgi:hypothetical protein
LASLILEAARQEFDKSLEQTCKIPRTQASSLRASTAKVERGKDEDHMDMDEPKAEQEVEEDEETVTMGISHYEHICDEFSFPRFGLADQRRQTREDKFLAEKRFAKQELLHMQGELLQSHLL